MSSPLTKLIHIIPYLFLEDRWQDHFARLRAEDPVHLNELETAGRYWSVTKYEDVRAVDGDWETYSSAKGITLELKKSQCQKKLNRKLVFKPS